jgi:hypothetical protein
MKTVNLFAMIKEGLRIALTSRALWLYGFFVGLGTTGNIGNRGHTLGASPTAQFASHTFTGSTVLLAIASIVLILAGVFMYFVSAGALIEGVTQVHRGKVPSVRGGWRDGLAHCGVLFQIAILYFAMSAGSLIVLVAPSLIALRLAGTAPAVILAIPAALIAVPWLATLYMWQAFASRIAVLENRRARDALLKARLFLHGRLLHGLKLIVAAILGRLIVVLVGAVGLAAAALFVIVVLKTLGMMHASMPVIILGTLALLPAVFGLIAISGTTQSSIWTIGYIVQQH